MCSSVNLFFFAKPGSYGVFKRGVICLLDKGGKCEALYETFQLIEPMRLFFSFFFSQEVKGMTILLLRCFFFK